MLPTIYWGLMLRGHEWLARPELLPQQTGSEEAPPALRAPANAR